jgi:hypothetical protein
VLWIQFQRVKCSDARQMLGKWGGMKIEAENRVERSKKTVATK